MKKPDVREELRACAAEALRHRGYMVENIDIPRVVQGARLRVKKGIAASRICAVRTSSERKVVLTQGARSKNWLTLSNVDEVIVSVMSLEGDAWAEIFSFTPSALKKSFDALVEKKDSETVIEKPHKKSRGSPVTIALDELDSDRALGLKSNLKAKARWSMLVPLRKDFALSPIDRSPTDSSSTPGFVERVRREFAALNGVDVSKVVVHFQILA